MSTNGTPPGVPDYNSLAQQNAASNAAATNTQTQANRPDQTDQFGNSSTWTQGPNGQWSQNIKFGQQGQQFNDQQTALRNALMGQAQSSMGQGLDFSKMPGFSNFDMSALQGVNPDALNNGVGGPGLLGGAGPMGQLQGNNGPMGQLQGGYGPMGNLQGAGQFNMDPRGNSSEIQAATSKLLAPERAQQRDAEIQRLKSQGLTENSEAFQRGMARLDEGDTRAQLQSLLAGTTEYGNQFNRAAGQNQQNFGQNFNAAQLANSQNQQQFAQDMGQAQFNSSNQSQKFNQDMGQAQFGNQSQNQQFNQNLAGANLKDSQNQQQFGRNLQQQQLAQALRGQQFGEQGAQAQLNGQQRQQMLNEQMTQRNAPLANLAQLMQQQANPQFGQFMGAGNPGGTDFLGAAQQQFNGQMGGYNAGQASQANNMSGLTGLLGGLLGAPAGSAGNNLTNWFTGLFSGKP
tara:strand:+ start:3589 stop:4962 length:1374 start_codon:yes stop_codon:yes gene_type:complete